MTLEPIAIIGIGCRFPGADNPEEFWQLLCDGRDAITEVPQSRWPIDQFYDPNPDAPNKTNTRWGGFLAEIDQFDPQFFGIAPREVHSMDPQHRLLLEVAWEAMEDGGQVPETLRGTQTGVFIGIGTHDYSIMLWQDPVNDPYATTGTGNCIAANRLSYIFDFKGPSLAVDTACSSSLVAVHLACQSLWQGESSLALAGGVNVLLLPTVTAGFSKGGFMSADGRCKSFDARADGYVRSEGAGIVVLKPLSQALKDRDPVYAVIRGSAVNQDGFSNGMAAPNPKAQAAVLQAAYQRAEVCPSQVQYIEAHGTGTKIGDPVELEALGRVITENRSNQNPCRIGSVKTNIGHLETAAGVAGLIKTALALKYQQIPPSLHFQTPNPQINFDQPICVQQTLTPWPDCSQPALAGVNSFGFGGTNAHVVLAQAPIHPIHKEINLPFSADKSDASKLAPSPFYLFTLSAKNNQALKELVQRYRTQLTQTDDISLADLCHTANARRSHFSHRLALVADSTPNVVSMLDSFLCGDVELDFAQGVTSLSQPPPLAFLFTGQGAQYVGMGKQLYQTNLCFRQTLEACDRILQQHLDLPLLDLLYSPDGPDSSATTASNTLLDQTAYTQPALFALEYSLAQLWLSWGIRPTVVMGHSVGEYVAACLAGVFSLEDGLRLIAARGRLMQALPQEGAMLAIAADEATVRSALSPYSSNTVDIAAFNGPQNIVISGQQAAIEAVSSKLQAAGVQTTPLQVSHAFHSAQMEPILEEFAQIAASITYHPPQLQFISNLTGALATTEIATPDYWCRHVRQPVNFTAGMEALRQQDYRVFVEIGPKPTLLGMGRNCLPPLDYLWLPSLRRGQSDLKQILRSLGELYTQGISGDWSQLSPQGSHAALHLPTYPFQRQRFWWDAAPVPGVKSSPSQEHLSIRQASHPLLGHQLFLAGSEEMRFQTQVSPTVPAYLNDHCLLEQSVFPATAYMEIALAAARHSFKEQCVSLQALVIEQPLILSGAVTLQCVLVPETSDHYTFEIFSSPLDGDKAQTRRHAVGKLQSLDPPATKAVALDTLKASFQDSIPTDDYYQRLREQGLHYGPSFQGIHHLWAKEGQVLSQIYLPEVLQADLAEYAFHPVLLDACFQTLGAAFTDHFGAGTYLPVGCDFLRLLVSPGQWVWSSAQVRSDSTASPGASSTVKVDIQLMDEVGTVVAEVEGLALQYVSQRSLEKLLGGGTQQSDLYELMWQLQPEVRSHPLQPQPHRWLIFADQTGWGTRLAHDLEVQGNSCILVYSRSDNTSGDYQLDPTCAQDFQALWQTLTEKDQCPDRILYLWTLDTEAFSNNWTPEELQRGHGCESILYLLQALPPSLLKPTALWLVTAGAVHTGEQLYSPHQAPLWGLGRVIRLEYPDLQCINLDLETEDWTEDRLTALTQELCCPDQENQVALRHGNRYVARLALRDSLQAPSPHSEAVRLGTMGYGVLDNLTLVPLQRRPPGPNEVEIQVCSAGINFRDVLNALGMLTKYMEQMGFAEASEIPFGGECAGKVVALGEDVTGLALGDPIIAAQAIGSLGQYVTVDAQFVIPKPHAWTFTEAATVPTAFLTAYYGLHRLAQIKAGDRILIHAAAGGVGQAAVQIAQQAGAEIFATASPGKWEFLKSLGIQHVMNSRTLDFGDEVMAQTNAQGVDIVLNCLNGEFIPKSLETLAPAGRFVEIGKLGIWDAAQMAQTRADVSYFPFDLLDISQEQPQLIAAMLRELLVEFEQHKLRPLPHKDFPFREAADAFRYMAQAKHMGKVVLTLPDADHRFAGIQEQGTYLITGGLGDLGLEVAGWLIEQGAQHLLLLGRRPPSTEAQEAIQKLEQRGADIHIAQVDVADYKALSEALSPYVQLLTSGSSALPPPLRGVIHAAGVLKDSTLETMAWEQFVEVFQPKVTGTWNLHQITQSIPLDFFVCFSSMASMLGSPAQGNYAAANAFMDALVHYRRDQGLPGLSINWGPWQQIGLAARLSEPEQARLSEQGIEAIAPHQGTHLLGELLQQQTPQVGAFSIDWSRFLPYLPEQVAMPFLEQIAPSLESVQVDSELRSHLTTLSAEERLPLLQTHLREQLAKVLGYPSAELIELHENFADLGMDSLMALEFHNRLQSSLGCNTPQSVLFDYPTIKALANCLNEMLSPAAQPPEQPSTEPQAASVSMPAAPPKIEIVEPEHPTSAEDSLVPVEPTLESVLAQSPQPNIKPEYYQFQQSPEYLNLLNDLDRVNHLGNPFFKVHEGIAGSQTEINGQQLLNFSSYNYLGLSGDPRIIAAVEAAIRRYGTSVSASRVLAGERSIHLQLEQAIAQFIGTEDCIVYVGGHATNVSTIGHLFRNKDLILRDALSHNSICEGCQLSGATVLEFPHNDWQVLEVLLKQHRHHYQKVLIAIEGIYSTDGDLAPLPDIVALKKHYKTFLLVDEAHSIGVLGTHGRGISEHFGVPATDVDFWMGTLSKSFASCGGYIAASQEIVQYLKYTSPGFVFSVGMSPANTAAALQAIQILGSEPDRVATLQDRAQLFRQLAKSLKMNTGASQYSPIIPIIVGEPYKAVQFSQALFDSGINVEPMVYPAVPYHAARLRFFMNCTHTEEQIQLTMATIKKILELDSYT